MRRHGRRPELLEIDYEIRPSQTDLASCLGDGAPVVHSGLQDNQCFDWRLGDEDAVDDALKGAAHVVELDLVQNRINAAPMETRGTIGLHDRGRDEYTLYTSNQNPHPIRVMLSASTLKVPEEKIRVISPDVGGGFGMKIYHYNEEVLVLPCRPQNRPSGALDGEPFGGIPGRYLRPRSRKQSIRLALTAMAAFWR